MHPVLKALPLHLLVMTTLSHAGWTPPPDPDPEVILGEIHKDTQAGNHEDALAKHVWFHENALKHDPALYGVRLSFALFSWVDLGKSYPPALEKLREIRDQAEEEVKAGRNLQPAFHDFHSINERLGEDGKTRDLFVWLHGNQPEAAGKAFGIAQSALVATKEYQLWGEYIDADSSFEKILDLHRKLLEFAGKQGDRGAQLKRRGEQSFIHDTSTLVALLVLNDRKDEAGRIAEAALKEWDDSALGARLEKAKLGELPGPLR